MICNHLYVDNSCSLFNKQGTIPRLHRLAVVYKPREKDCLGKENRTDSSQWIMGDWKWMIKLVMGGRSIMIEGICRGTSKTKGYVSIT